MLKSSFFFVVSMFFATSVMADVLPQTTLRLTAPDNNIVFTDLNVQIKVHCSYSSGIFWRERKSCTPNNSNNNFEVAVNSDGSFVVPAIPYFKGMRGASNINNYELNLSVREASNQLFLISAEGKAELLSLAKETEAIQIKKLLGTEILVNVAGSPLVGSEYARIADAALGAFLLIDDKQVEGQYKIYLTRYSDYYKNSENHTNKVTDFKRFVIPEQVFAYKTEFPKSRLSVSYEAQGAIYNFEVPLVGEKEELTKLQSVDLQLQTDSLEKHLIFE